MVYQHIEIIKTQIYSIYCGGTNVCLPIWKTYCKTYEKQCLAAELYKEKMVSPSKK